MPNLKRVVCWVLGHKPKEFIQYAGCTDQYLWREWIECARCGQPLEKK